MIDGDALSRGTEGVDGCVGLSNRLSSEAGLASYDRDVAAPPLLVRCPSSLLAFIAFITASGLPLGLCGMPLPLRDRFDEGMMFALLPVTGGLDAGE